MHNTFYQRLRALLPAGASLQDIVLLTLAFLALIASFFELPLPIDAGWLTILLCGVPIIYEAFHAVIKEHNIKADLLVSLALLASIYIGEIFAAAEIAFIMQLGAALEDITVRKAQSDIQKLISLTPQSARRLFNGEEHLIAAEFVHANDIIKVLPGETVPVDGVVLTGATSIDQSVMTGESLPVDKAEGDTVYSGTINQYGAFTLRATKDGADSSMQRMISLVKNADAGKAKIVGLADKWATYIVLMALATACVTFLLTGESSRAVTVLVVFCPCALVLATPTAIMAAIGNATRHGFLVREGDALERLAQVKQLAFDKTGTLTFGKLQVTAIQSFSDKYSTDELYHLAASVEAQSEHPLGKAIVRSYRKQHKSELLPVTAFTMFPGKGLTASINNKNFYLGNSKLLAKAGIIAVPASQASAVKTALAQGATLIYIACDDEVLGFIALADTLRPQSSTLINTLQKLNISTTLLTGDNAAAAASVAKAIGINKVEANCLPEDKLH